MLVVAKLDRLARSTLDLLRIMDRIGKEGAAQEPRRTLGRHHDPAWAADADGAGRHCRLCGHRGYAKLGRRNAGGARIPAAWDSA